jgi:hypothetical protein
MNPLPKNKKIIRSAFNYFRFNLIAVLILSAASLYQIYDMAVKKNILSLSISWNLAIWAIGIWLIFLLILVILSSLSSKEILSNLINSFFQAIPPTGLLKTLIIISLLISEVIILILFGDYLHGITPQLAIIWFYSFIISLIVQSFRKNIGTTLDWFISQIFAALLIAIVNQIIVLFSTTTNFPLALGWSEASRYYYASLIFSKNIYGFSVPLSPIHPSRYLLQSIPFIINNLPIWVHRAWQNLLWLVFPLLLILSIVKRVNLTGIFNKLIFVFWAFLFLSQGPFYYHLAPCAFLVIFGYSNQNLKKSLLFVIFASIWAGISRINWVPIPGLIAAALFLLESPYSGKLFQYFKVPALFVIVGSIIGLITQLAYIPIAGYSNSELFTSSFTSDLLWYRLFPNSTYPLGILPAILIVSFPIGIYVFYSLFSNNLHLIRKIGIVSILVALFSVGLVVSVKIGGGSNIHNFDAFLLFLLLTATYFYSNETKPDKINRKNYKWKPKLLFALIIILPILWELPFTFSFADYHSQEAVKTIDQINLLIEKNAPQKKVLFISQRQLLTFGYIKNVPLIPEYEQIMLMEMAMAQNKTYLDKFSNDLSSQKYEMIVTFPQDKEIRDYNYTSPEESNAWNKRIAKRLLNNYNIMATYPEFGIEILIPIIK